MSLLALFCAVDDFCIAHPPGRSERVRLGDGKATRQRVGQLCESEMLTIMIHFHQARHRNFKVYYTEYVQRYLWGEFPRLVSYTRFVALMPRLLHRLYAFLTTLYGNCSGISFIDSTCLPVCDNHRIHRHRVFDGLASRGKTSMGWFFGFKLHLVFNDGGELLSWCLSPGHTHDVKPVPKLARRLTGRLFGDRGYIFKPLAHHLFRNFGLRLITKLRKKMKNMLMPLEDKLLLRRRSLSETIHDQLKNLIHIQHTRHRSTQNFLVNLISGLIAYCLRPNKPSLHLRHHAAILA